jgi:erythronate-4-phosphate dehydrogenase
MKKIRIIADDKIPFLRGALEAVADVVYLPGAAISNDDIRSADALLIRTRTHCNASLLAGSSVKFIATATIGYDHIDTGYCEENNISWTNAPGCNSSSVEQYFVSALLTLAVNLKLDLSGMCLGIIGAGHVGSKVARAAEILGLKVLLNDPPRAKVEGASGFESLEKIKKEADIISFHVPLNFEGLYKTAGMADHNFFESLKKKVILVNTSRGEVVNEPDLSDAMNKSLIRALVLDVWINEPMINKGLLEKATLVSPHIAGYSTDGKANGTRMIVQALSRFFKLGLDNWSPENVPLPENTFITADCTGKAEVEILQEVYSQTYDILVDDAALRSDVPGFEALRGKYRLRREPPAWSIRLINNSWPDIELKLQKLGFSVLATNGFCEIKHST